jgi:hypothetical protein
MPGSMREEDDNEVVSVNTIAGEVNLRADKGLRTPDKSWLDLEDEDNFQVYHANVIVNEDEPCELGSCCSSDKEYKSPNWKRAARDSVEGHWGTGVESEEDKGTSDAEGVRAISRVKKKTTMTKLGVQ